MTCAVWSNPISRTHAWVFFLLKKLIDNVEKHVKMSSHEWQSHKKFTVYDGGNEGSIWDSNEQNNYVSCTQKKKKLQTQSFLQNYIEHKASLSHNDNKDYWDLYKTCAELRILSL